MLIEYYTQYLVIVSN